ncbi:hypothetical protein Bca52824_025034 [Brassica carinata]|uniref:Uncharacterized protein n=1 Tax=Brassica carinata TaxID=52824 RepID=A0A8X8AWB4_BRACI|nr:hypothetical protein Bca52824_025034 [Brassica carinata]
MACFDRDIVLAQFILENSGTVQCSPYRAIRPVDPPVSLAPGHAQLWRLAYIKVPSFKEDFGPEEEKYLHTVTLGNSKDFNAMIEEKYTYGGQVKGQGTGTEIAVTLIAVDNEISINFAMLLVFSFSRIKSTLHMCLKLSSQGISSIDSS